MVVDLCKTNISTDESEFFLVCTNSQYKDLWEPAISLLRLPMLDCLPGLEITSEYQAQFIEELEEVRKWVEKQPDFLTYKKMATSIDEILEVVSVSDLTKFRLAFG